MFMSKIPLSTSIMNKYGHCENYDFSLEFEIAVATFLEQKSSFLISDIKIGQGNALFHSDWDNFGAVFTGMHNKTHVHMEAGTMLQEKTARNG